MKQKALKQKLVTWLWQSKMVVVQNEKISNIANFETIVVYKEIFMAVQALKVSKITKLFVEKTFLGTKRTN